MDTLPVSRDRKTAAETRLQHMHALLDEWAEEIARHPVGCLELHFAEAQVKASLRVSLGHKKLS